jgi:hypothetical protein
MRAPWCALAVAVVLALAASPPASADAAFGFLPGSEGFEVSPIAEGGGPADLAGSHPYALSTSVAFEPESPASPGAPFTDGDLRDLTIEEPAGMVEDPDAVPKCSQLQFGTPRSSPFEEPSRSGESCPADTQVGVVTVETSFAGGSSRRFGVFNLAPPPGVPSELGFSPYGVPVTFDSTIRAEGEYGLTLESRNFPQRLDLSGFQMTLWGYPWGVAHNGERGNCLNEAEPSFPWAKCSVGPPQQFPPQPYLTLPTFCAAPLHFTARADSWQQPTVVAAQSEPFTPQGCDSLLFGPQPSAQLLNPRASSPSGFNFGLFSNAESPLTHRVPSQTRKAVISLPEGVTVNPSVGAGLGVCTPGQYAAETASSLPGEGCPNASKIGDFTVHSPLFEEALDGAIFLAQPDLASTTTPGAENPFDTLIALYLVAKAPQRGIVVKVAGKLEPDLRTGQLVATFDNLPQLPYTNLEVHFREGQRSPLVTPTGCGTYLTHEALTPWLGTLGGYETDAVSEIEAGIGGGPCPSAATPPFTPQATAGTLNPNAGSYTPFYLHLTRTDTEQEITSYSTRLAPGLLGKIAGIPYCPEAAIAAAKQETGVEELEHPSCPAASEIGHTTSGYGVGSTLAYAPGRLYLAGPYHGSSFSIVAVDSALVGPFDLGVVIVRSAIEVNPDNAQVSIDSSASDPIPHIIDGIPIHLRDVRVYISRPETTINPTSCEPFSITSTLDGSAPPFTDPISASSSPVDHFQVSYCSSLGFAPKLAFRLDGGTRRGNYPSLRAVLTPHPGDANIAAATVTLPPSEFLAQNHIETICTNPQAAAERCPPGSIIGNASVTTPLLGVPMSGPVYLRSSDSKLPDLAVALRGQGIGIDLDGKIDSFHGGLRARFEGLPDAPVSKFVLTLNGGKRGLLVNSANLCTSTEPATVRMVGQNNKGAAFSSPLHVRCPKHKKARQR